jgi:hypothetical protein
MQKCTSAMEGFIAASQNGKKSINNKVLPHNNGKGTYSTEIDVS